MTPLMAKFTEWWDTSDNPALTGSETVKHYVWSWMRAAFRAGWEAQRKQSEEGNVFE